MHKNRPQVSFTVRSELELQTRPRIFDAKHVYVVYGIAENERCIDAELLA